MPKMSEPGCGEAPFGVLILRCGRGRFAEERLLGLWWLVQVYLSVKLGGGGRHPVIQRREYKTRGVRLVQVGKGRHP